MVVRLVEGAISKIVAAPIKDVRREFDSHSHRFISSIHVEDIFQEIQ